MAGEDIAGMSKDELHRQILLAEALRAGRQAQSVSPMPPRADPVDYVAPETEQGPTNFRGKFSKEGMDLATAALSGGVVDIPDVITADQIGIPKGGTLATSGPLYALEGEDLPVPKILQDVFEFLGNAVATAGGLGQAGYGYLIGGAADILVKAGMDKNSAERMANTAMAMPEAFVGSPQQLMMASGGVKVSAKKPAAITTATISKVFSPEDIAKLQSLEIATPPRADAPLAAGGGRIEPPVSRSKAATQLSPDSLGELIRLASSGGRGSQKAAEALAEAAKVNPDAAAAARRLGIDVPADILSDDTQLRSAAGLSRSIAGSDAEADFRNLVVAASRRAEEVMAEMDATPDISTVAARIKTTVLQTRASLETAARGLYKKVDGLVPESSLVDPRNSVMLLNKMLEELGGVGGLSGKEKQLFDKLTDPDTPLTYAALKKFRTSIGKAVNKGEGEFADLDTGTAKRIYAALTEDYLSTAQRVGGDEARATLRLANQTTVKQKALEKRMVNFFAKDGEKSIAGVLRTAMSSGANRGDITNLNRVLKLVPPEMQREALATALSAIARSDNVAFDGPFDFAKFSSTFNALKVNNDVYKTVVRILGPETEKVLNDLNNISKRITQGRAAVIPTGKANQALVQAITAEGLSKRVFQKIFGSRIVRATVGQAAGGPAGGMAIDALGEMLLSKTHKKKIAAAGDFFNSSAFQKLSISASETEIAAAIKTPAFKRLANALKINDGRVFLEGALIASFADEGVINPAEAPAPAPETINESPALQSLLQAMTPAQRAKIQQAVP
jgi:hypothetical protein